MRQAHARFLITRLSAAFSAFLTCLACFATPCLGAVAQADSIIVPLLVRPVVVSDASTRAFWTALASTPARQLHGLLWLPRHPSPEDTEALRAVGIMILTPVVGRTYWALVTASADTSRSPIRPLRLATIEPRDRVAPRIWAGQLSGYVVRPSGSEPLNYLINADSTLNLVVFFHQDTRIEQAEEILRGNSSAIKRISARAWTIIAQRDQLRRLAQSDRVHWIDAALPPLLPDNDKTRAVIKVDGLQMFNTAAGTVGGLGGQNVIVGVFDTGIDETHDDFGNRVILNDVAKNWHATHVAGVIAGDGKLSTGSDSWMQLNGGTPYQWRGMAPQAQLIDADANSAFFADKMRGYVETTGMDISNHSYSYGVDGAYTWDVVADALIAGHATYDGLPISPRLYVYSTGNHGKEPTQGGEQVGYFALTKQSKNGLMVGAYDPVLSRIDPNSSLGPAYDGRIKPDVVAPGANVWSTAYCEATLPKLKHDPFSKCVNPTGITSRSDFYQMVTGSSDAAAAVTGMLALVLQQHSITFGGSHKPPLPSTLRAITVQTAHDIASPTPWFTNADGPVQAFPGPDFVTGYGMVDAQAAVNVVKNRLYVEDVVAATCQTRSWWIRTRGGRDLRVTLAWDDLSADPALPNTSPRLVNDLDLELIEPVTNTKYYPWLLDQRVVNAAGNTVANNEQSCGTPLTVERKVLPTATPNHVAPGDPSNINDPLAAGAIQPAGTGKDHINNIEQVWVPAARAGWWEARVTGFNILTGPQSYSLTVPERRAIKPSLGSFCGAFPGCNNIGKRICERVPELCEPLVIEVLPGRIPIEFRDMRDVVFLPMDRVCLFLIDCPLCGAGQICRISDVVFEQMPLPFTLEVYDNTGNRVFADRSMRRTKRISFAAQPGHDYLLVIGPVSGVRVGKQYSLPVKAAAQ
jgi:subtilisin family serine protease